MSIRGVAVRIGGEEETTMTHYLLSIYQPDGDRRRPRSSERS